MYRIVISVLAFAVVGVAAAHHPPRMERCASVEFSGEVERIEWRNPHVQLVIRTDDGMSHQITWLSINQLALADIDMHTLSVGERVDIVAGIRQDDVTDQPLLLSYISRASDGWGWSQLPQGC